MTVRLRSRKPYFSAWVPVTGAALALLLCAGFTVLAVLQADKSWTVSYTHLTLPTILRV